MQLIPVDPTNEAHLYCLYDLLEERTPEQSISHKQMPTFGEHQKFVESNPYTRWYLIELTGYVGAIYLSRRHEIGISIFRQHQNLRYGTRAVELLMDMHPGRYLANVNPENEPSKRLWESLGGKVIQVTFELESEK